MGKVCQGKRGEGVDNDRLAFLPTPFMHSVQHFGFWSVIEAEPAASMMTFKGQPALPWQVMLLFSSSISRYWHFSNWPMQQKMVQKRPKFALPAHAMTCVKRQETECRLLVNY